MQEHDSILINNMVDRLDNHEDNLHHINPEYPNIFRARMSGDDDDDDDDGGRLSVNTWEWT